MVVICAVCIGYTMRWSLYGIYTTECRRHKVVYTVETKTELYNRLVPWGIATRLRYKKRTIHHGFTQFSVLERSLKGGRNRTPGNLFCSNWTNSTVPSETEPARKTMSYLDRLTPLSSKREWTSSNCPLEDVLDNPSVSNDRSKTQG